MSCVCSLRIQQGKPDWYGGRREDFREPFRKRTLDLSEEWKKGRAAKEDAKASAQEGQKDEVAGDKEKEEGAKEAEEKPKPKQPEATVVEDSEDDDVVVVGEIRPAPKASRGGKKSNIGKATRLR